MESRKQTWGDRIAQIMGLLIMVLIVYLDLGAEQRVPDIVYGTCAGYVLLSFVGPDIAGTLLDKYIGRNVKK